MTILDLFHEQAATRRNSVALRLGPDALSYGELDRRSDGFARALRMRGVGKGTLVGLLLERSLDLYVAMLATAKLGAAFVPLETTACADLLRPMLRDNGIRYLVTEEESHPQVCRPSASDVELISLKSLSAGELCQDSVDVEVHANDALYVMFTSGSTGIPKGVVVPHRAVVRLVRNQTFAKFGPEEVFCQFAPVSFDASTLEIWGSLLTGGCLVVPPPHVLSLDDMARVIREQQVTTIWMTAALFHLAADKAIELFAPLKRLLFGGDVISPARVARLQKMYPSLAMVNGYGPTENTTFTACYEVPADFKDDGRSLPIGKPIAGTTVYILDEQLCPVAAGERGQLCAAGDGLALGYLCQEALTKEKFVRDPIAGSGLMYLTGDMVRQLPDGNIEFLGRIDGQVKVNGHRVELGAVETVLREDSKVREAVAMVYGAPNAEKQIVAFVELKPQESAGEAELRAVCNAKLAHYEVPSRIYLRETLPIGATGKIDRQALLASLTEKKTKPVVTSVGLEERVSALWKQILGRDDIEKNTPFFEQGGTSLQMIEMHHELQSWGYSELSIVELFQHATVHHLVEHLKQSTGSEISFEPKAEQSDASNTIAVIGMAGRFPGAKTPAELWKNFVEGREAIRTFTDDELEDSFDQATRNSDLYVKKRAILDDVETFDAEFFGLLPKEAELTDPQQRLLLECAWESLEDAGYASKAYPGRIGVFAGASINTYLLRHICADRRFVEEFTSVYQVGAFPMLVGNGADFTASRISYKLDLRGPAMTVQSACSTSLLAVAQAIEGLRSRKMDMALAGAASVSLPQRRGYLYQQGGMVSADGHCRPFDAQANGTVFGSGAAMVLLKRYEDAVRDGDHIYALIRGVGINNDGSAKAGYAAPSVDGQAASIVMAHTDAGVAADTIDYVECHGTGTPLGDPIEVAALSKAFRQHSSGTGHRCAISSAKSAVGHLDVAAGVTGLIRACLALHHETIPGTLHYLSPNPRMELEKTPFYVTAENTPWSRNGHARRAGVSAFGVGGTNVHLVLEEAPQARISSSGDRYYTLPIAARSAEALNAYRQSLQKYFETRPDVNVADAAYTLSLGREPFAWRTSVCGRNPLEIAAALGSRKDAYQAQQAPDVIFLFPGQGAQYPGMAAGLYATEPVFRATVDECFEAGKAYLPAALKNLICAGKSEDADLLRSTENAQPALFVVEYSLARLWMSWGIQPTAMIGHSVGEITAACVAGVFSLPDALKLVALRGRMMQRMEPGAMLSVRMPAAELAPYLERHQLSLASVNSPVLCVASGPSDRVAALETELTAKNVQARKLHTSHAFHSAMVDGILPELAEVLGSISLHAPTHTIFSSCTGEELTAERAQDPSYWTRHCRETVQFASALANAAKRKKAFFLELGPGQTLETLARQQLSKDGSFVFGGSLPGPDAAEPSNEVIQRTLGTMWSAGGSVQWPAVFQHEKRVRISLPTYPFQRKRYWIEAPKAGAFKAAEAAEPVAEPKVVISAVPNNSEKENLMPNTTAQVKDRKSSIAEAIRALLEELSGVTMDASQDNASFVELGFDSLFLTQVTQEVQKRHGVKVTFRQLLGEYASVQALTEFLDGQLPASAFLPQAAAPSVPEVREEPKPAAMPAAPMAIPPSGNGLESLLREQLQAMSSLMQRQLEVLQGTRSGEATRAATAAPAIAAVAAPAQNAPAESKPQASASVASALLNVPKASSTDLTAAQQKHIDRLIELYTKKTAGSKRLTQQYRSVLADPRVVAGFRPEWKEMVYSIVTDRSKGSKLWDVDGNEYIDLVNGFGPTMFGHAPDFVTKAIAEQMQHGFEIGPQSPLAGKVAQLISELTGNERVTFCNTGSEAVMAAIRIARTVTGRNKIVFFGGDYHGQFDEVLVKPIRRNGIPQASPAAPGIPAENLSNIVVLEYGSAEALEYIRQHASEFAAVMVEPVQSRHPNLQPKEFLQEVRRITEAAGTAFIFDEVVNGFRVHPGGAQAVFGVRADLVTYGKVVGGGMPLGILAGRAQFMDALDGGSWNFGDNSAPEVGMTFFAGTFVRHPLTLAATHAVLSRMKEEGPGLQASLNDNSDKLARRINQTFEKWGLTARMENFGSVFYFNLHHDTRFASLFYFHLRAKGLHILEGFPCYITTEHSQADFDHIVQAFDQTLAEMSADGLIETKSTAVAATAAKPAVRKTSSPLTEAQLEVMLAAQLSDAASCAFNESFSLKLEGVLDVDGLREALNTVVSRHDALRSVLAPSGDSLLYRETLKLETPLVDLSGLKPEEQQSELSKMKEHEAVTAFDLHEGPLVRTQLVRLAADTHLLIWTGHHVVCDGWSTNVLLDELSKVYSSRRNGTALKLDPVLSFAEFAERLVAQKNSAEQQQTEQFWAKQFESTPALLDLPTDFPRPAQRSFAGNTCYAMLPASLNASLRQFSAKRGCTKFVTLLGAFQLLLARLAQQDDTVVLVPSAAQSQVEDAVLVGHGVNLLPIRMRADAEMTTAAYLKKLNSVVLDAYEHAGYTFGSLVQKLNVKREPGRLPLSEIQFNLEKVGDGLRLDGLKASVRSNGKRFTNFDLFLNIVDDGSELRLECDYNSEIFEEATILRWMGHYRTLLESMVASADSPASRLSVLSEAETRHILHDMNATEEAYPSTSTLPMLIAEQAAGTPNKIAVRDAAEHLTYAELERRSGQIASRLIAMGTRPNDMVGLLVDRSVNMLVALIGIHKAGATYVPLDPIYPKARIEFILNETQVPVLITQQHHLQNIPVPTGTQVLCLDRDAAKVAASEPARNIAKDPSSLAYAIYTSGSTGQPKGVEISHRALVNLLCSAKKTLQIGESERLLAVTTISFDIAGLELFMPLIAGATVFIASKADVADGKRLSQLVADAGITVMQGTPSTWKLLLEAGFHPASGFKVLCGGEAWSRELADRLLAVGCRIWNMYGPTETTIWSSITAVKAGTRAPFIQSSVANTTFYVLDNSLQPLPFGVPGQLYIGGDSVARGYFRRPELTASRFLGDPFVSGNKRMYATGDRVRQLVDGSIEFLGRADFQVKIRGYRIELGEVESAFSRVAGVSEVVAVAHNFGGDDLRLVLYYVSNAAVETAAIRSGMRELVPDYMVPAMFVRMDRLPLTDNGKIDRKALPAPARDESASSASLQQPQTPMETTLASICAQVLGVTAVGTDQDLLDLGADSIHLFQITARGAQKGLPLTAKLLWSHRTVEKICAAMETVSTANTLKESTIRPRSRERYRVPVTE